MDSVNVVLLGSTRVSIYWPSSGAFRRGWREIKQTTLGAGEAGIVSYDISSRQKQNCKAIDTLWKSWQWKAMAL